MGVPTTPPTPANSAHTDANQQFSIIGVAGTLGTADVSGTAPTVPIGANPLTGAMFVQDLSGASGTTNVLIVGGTFNAGTVTTGAGTQAVRIVDGTVTNLATGTLNRIGSIDTIGTMPAISLALNTGTITTIAAGTQNTLGTVGVVNTGTLAALASGTITGGTLQNLVSGTINALASGTITTGTVSVTTGTVVGNVASASADSGNPVKIGGINNTTKPTFTDGQRGDLQIDTRGNLQSSLWSANSNTPAAYLTDNTDAAGTSSSANKMAVINRNQVFNGVSWDRLKGDTGGIYVQGTTSINPVPVPSTQTFGTLGTAGGSFFGTLSAAAGAGTKHYITGLQVIGQSGTADVRILAGTSIQGTGILGAGIVVPGGGFVRDFTLPYATGTNSELTYHFVGAGTAFIVVNYWKGT